MKALDTNILVRFLVADDEIQTKQVYTLFKKTENNDKSLFVPVLVMLDVILVLESVYNISRDDILKGLSKLILMPILKFENRDAIQSFIYYSRDSDYDLSDLLIASTAKQEGCETVLTFDKKASDSKYFSPVDENI